MNGLTYKASSENHGVSETIIGKWRKRFANAGIEGLFDAPRSGRPTEFTDAARMISQIRETGFSQ